MTILRLHGTVDWDRSDNAVASGYVPHIGGVDVIAAIEESFDTAFGSNPKRVTVAIADERFTGDLYSDCGVLGWSEYTPSEPAALTVGPHNLLAILERFDEDEAITLWVADEPINTLDSST
jgi:hypothetical protein